MTDYICAFNSIMLIILSITVILMRKELKE